MVNGSKFLDVIPDAEAATVAQLRQVDAWVSATVTEQVDGTSVAIRIDGADEDTPDVVAPSESGVSAVGAAVRALRDSTGRVIRVSIPDEIPEGAETFSVGVTGDRLVQLDATTAAQGAQLDAAQTALDEARAKLNDPETGLDATQEKANSAANNAAAALTAAGQAVEDASSAVVLRVDSSRGLVFKNSLVSTVLSVTIFAKARTITDIVDLQDVFGPGAYLEWQWRRMDDTDFGVISSVDSRIGAGGFTLTVSPADVDVKTVFMCVLKT